LLVIGVIGMGFELDERAPNEANTVRAVLGRHFGLARHRTTISVTTDIAWLIAMVPFV
jgi:hypothetical protein